MAMRTDPEPAPRRSPLRWSPPAITVANTTALPREVATPDISFLAVLQGRRSSVGGEITLARLSSLLWHGTALRRREPAGRSGMPWESRPSPSAGGLHPISVVCLPLGGDALAGLYDPDAHAMSSTGDPSAALAANARSIGEIIGATNGVTLQFAGDQAKVDACYENAASLVWRDAGALAATFCLVATALGLASTIVGRHGTQILEAYGLGGLTGLGAVHVGGRLADHREAP